MKASPQTVYLPDTRGVSISSYGRGNAKIGSIAFTYSRVAGRETDSNFYGTCPGSTEECERICYAKRIVGDVLKVYRDNSVISTVPPIPDEARWLRIHVSGDFDSVDYIEQWFVRLQQRPDVSAWAYTRSWRVPSLLFALEQLRALPNLQLFASMDKSHTDMPPKGWRRAWIDGDGRAGTPLRIMAHADIAVQRNLMTLDGARTFVCPEETGHQADCLSCRYCIHGVKNDVTFLEH